MSAVMEWLCNERRLSPKTIAEAGIYPIEGGDEVFAIPYRQDGRLVTTQYRNIRTRDFRFEKDTSPELIYLPTGKLPKDYDKPIYVTEGAIDALTLHQLGLPSVGIPSATLYTGIKNIPCKVLALALDNDPMGNQAVDMIAALGSPHKLLRAQFTAKDPNEQYVATGKFDHELVPYVAGGIKHLSSIKPHSRTDDPIVQAGWGIPGWNPGELVILYGKEKAGKTTLLFRIASRTKTPALVEEFEVTPERVREQFDAFGYHEDTPVYITTQFGEFQYHNLLARVYGAIKAFGVKWVIIDNIHFMASGHDNVVNVLANVTQRLKVLAMSLGIVVVMIAHATGDQIRDCRLMGGHADHILYLRRLNNAIIIEGTHRFEPKGTYEIPIGEITPRGETNEGGSREASGASEVRSTESD